MFNDEQIVRQAESVILNESKVKTPIWKLEIVADWMKYLGLTLGIRLTYWGKASV